MNDAGRQVFFAKLNEEHVSRLVRFGRAMAIVGAVALAVGLIALLATACGSAPHAAHPAHTSHAQHQLIMCIISHMAVGGQSCLRHHH